MVVHIQYGCFSGVMLAGGTFDELECRAVLDHDHDRDLSYSSPGDRSQ